MDARTYSRTSLVVFGWNNQVGLGMTKTSLSETVFWMLFLETF